ncbi:guanyl-specific ribonuclease F1 [Naviculisporaceae sp. PSN 640]
MQLLNSILVAFAACGATAAALATPGTTAIANVTCGLNTYSQQQIEEATAEGCRLYDEGQQIGTSKYPHKFNNREGLVFASSGPYQEFPIIRSGVYSGRSPGADRIVFDPDYKNDCVFVGAMTHTDAPTRNGFVPCEIAELKTPTTSPAPTGTGSSVTPTGTSGASSITGLGAQGVLLGLAAFTLQMVV